MPDADGILQEKGVLVIVGHNLQTGQIPSRLHVLQQDKFGSQLTAVVAFGQQHARLVFKPSCLGLSHFIAVLVRVFESDVSS